MKKFSLVLFIIVLLFDLSLIAQVDSTNEYINLAIQLNPKIRMLEQKKEAARMRIAQVSNLPNPMLGFGLMNLPVNSFSLNREPMSGKVIELSQDIPFPGKLKLMGNVESKDVAMIENELQEMVNEIRKEFLKEYNELRFIRKNLAIIYENEKLLKNIADVIRSSYTVSMVSQQNLLRIELELTKLSEMIEMLKGMENERVAVLNAFLLRSSDSPIYTSEFPQITFLSLSIDSLVYNAMINRPYVYVLKEAQDKEKLKGKLARYDFYPDFKFSVQYLNRSQIINSNEKPMDLLSFIIGIMLPLNYGGKISSKINESQYLQQMYDEEINNFRQTLSKEIGSLLSRLKSLQLRIKLIEDGSLIQANENLKTTLTDYQVGKVDFINLIDAQQNLLMIENDLFRLKTDYLNELVELEYLIGEELK